MSSLTDQFGPIDIYLFDQLLKGRIAPGMRILDAGCGGGRNLVYLLREAYNIFGADADPRAVDATRRLAASLSPNLAPENFRQEPIENMSFPNDFADVIISSAVLHFARDEAHFNAMLRSMWRVLGPGGLLFCRLASSIGLAESKFRRTTGRRAILPDGGEYFLVDEPLLMKWTAEFGGELVDPIKTSVVQNLRSMTTWVVRKRV